MAKKAKKTRKELLKEPDEFITLTGKLIQFSRKNRKELIAGVGLFIILLIVFSAIRYVSRENEKQAFALLNLAETKYANVSDQAPTEAFEAVQADFQLLVDEYGGKTGGKIAKITFADICFKAGNTDQAIALYLEAQKDFADHPTLANLILSGLGYAHGKKGEQQEAIEYFEKVILSGNTFMKADALFQLGCLYGNGGDAQKSMEAYNRIVAEFPESVHIRLVKEKV